MAHAIPAAHGPGADRSWMRAGLAWLAGGLVLLSSSGAQAQTPAELQRYQRKLDHLFNRLDRNGDQRLDRQEVQGHPYLQRHFQRLDQNKRGYLEPQDLQAGSGQQEDRAQRFFEQADRNGDGRLDRREAEPYPWLRRQFSNADRNRDGRVDPNELRGLADQRRRQVQPQQP